MRLLLFLIGLTAACQPVAMDIEWTAYDVDCTMVRDDKLIITAVDPPEDVFGAYLRIEHPNNTILIAPQTVSVDVETGEVWTAPFCADDEPPPIQVILGTRKAL